MPQIQMLDPGYSFGSELGKQLGTGFGAGLSSGVQNYYDTKRKKQTASGLADQVFPGLPDQQKSQFVDALSNLDPKDQPKALEALMTASILGSYLQQQQGNQQGQSGQSSGGATANLRALSPEANLNQNAIQQRQQEQDIPAIGPLKGLAEQQSQRRALDQRKFESGRKYEMDLGAGDILKRSETQREALPLKESAIRSMRSAITEGVGTKDYLADILNIEPLRTKAGAQFLTGGKEFLLGNLARAGSRPNQWIEQQISTMAPKIGRSKHANEATLAMLETENDIAKKRLEITDQLAEKYKNTTGVIPASIGRETDTLLREYADKRNDQLAYDLRVLSEREMGQKEMSRLKKVPQGTPLTVEMAKILVSKYGNEAEKMAKQLGYTIPDEDIYMRSEE